MIIATTMVAVFLAMVQFGIRFHAQRVAEAAAREGAVAGAHWNGSAGTGRAKAQAFVADDGAPAVTGSRVSSSRSATRARVTVTVEVVSLLWWLDDPITQSATVPVERFAR
ncbi:MAG: pilus assembly protein [Brachybacterium sp.]|nr:pilus assembly protein [Brachybacterium sp.]